MKEYKAVVKDTATGVISIITLSGYRNIKDAAADARRNGYQVVGGKVKEAKEFDRIMNETDCHDWDWHPNRKAYEGF